VPKKTAPNNDTGNGDGMMINRIAVQIKKFKLLRQTGDASVMVFLINKLTFTI
jgi:hypothetical protein